MIDHLLGEPYWNEADQVIYDLIKITGIREFVLMGDAVTSHNEDEILNESLKVVSQYLIHLYGYVLKNSFTGEIQDEIERIKVMESYTKIHSRHCIVISLEDFAPHFKINPRVMRDLCIEFLRDRGIKVETLKGEPNVQVLWELVLEQKSDHYNY